MSKVEEVADRALDLTNEFIEDIQKTIGGRTLSKITLQEKILLTGILGKLMRSATGMIKEKRALEKDAREAAEEMSFEDQRNFCLEFIKALPPEHRKQLKVDLGWAKAETRN